MKLNKKQIKKWKSIPFKEKNDWIITNQQGISVEVKNKTLDEIIELQEIINFAQSEFEKQSGKTE